MLVGRKPWYLIGLLIVVLTTACTSGQVKQVEPLQPVTSDGLNIKQPTPVPSYTIPAQIATPTPPPSTGPGSVPASGVGAAR